MTAGAGPQADSSFSAGLRLAGRVGLVIAALVSVGAAVLFAASWIDVPPDSTCSAVIYPDSWWDRNDCRTVMTARTAITTAILVIGIVLAWLGVRRRDPPRYALVISWLAFVIVVAIMFVNAVVRSGGGLG